MCVNVCVSLRPPSVHPSVYACQEYICGGGGHSFSLPLECNINVTVKAVSGLIQNCICPKNDLKFFCTCVSTSVCGVYMC